MVIKTERESQYYKCPPVARRQAWKWHGNTQKHSAPLNPTHQSDTASNHSDPALLSGRLVGKLWARFCSPLDWGQGCLAAINLDVIVVTTISWDYCTFGSEAANDAQTVWVNTACGKDHSQTNLSKLILWYRNICSQITSDVWRNQ